MPIVSVNLSDLAYATYRAWKQNRRGSYMTSAAIVQYQTRMENAPMLQLEDRRTLADGTNLVWTEEGWGLE